MNRALSPRHQLLRTALRQGDPGAGAALAPEEEGAMRRATLDAAAASGHHYAGRLAGHPGTTGWSTLRLLAAAAAAAAAICVAVAVSWVSWQGRPWLRRAAQAAPRPQQQRPGLAARRPQPPPLGSTALLDRRAPRRPRTAAPARVAAGDEPGVIAHIADAAGGTGEAQAAGLPDTHVAEAAGVLDTAEGAEAAGRPGADARRSLLASAAPADPSFPSATVADLGPEPGAEEAGEAAAEAAGAPVLLAPDASAAAGPSAPPRQVQFSLPGGTRVIWLVREPTPR